MNIKTDYVQLPANPSLRPVSGIPCPSCWKLTNQNNLEEKTDPLKTMYVHLYIFSMYTCSFLGLLQQLTVWLLPLLTSLKVICSCSCTVSVSFFLWTSPSLVPLPYNIYLHWQVGSFPAPPGKPIYSLQLRLYSQAKSMLIALEWA